MMLLEIVTPERLLLSEEVEEVILPGELGQLGILPGHHPLLEKKTANFTNEGKRHTISSQQEIS